MNKTAIILAGGENKRIGKIKALLQLDKSTIIEFIIQSLKKIFNEIIIVTNQRAEFLHLDAKIVEDIISGVGPIGGIHSGLIHSTSAHSFVISCDMPFVNVNFIKYMESLLSDNDIDIVVPKTKNGYEALHAFYSKTCILPIETNIKRKRFEVISIFDKVKTREVEEPEFENLDLEKRTFFNINTEDDYKNAKEIYAKYYKQ